MQGLTGMVHLDVADKKEIQMARFHITFITRNRNIGTAFVEAYDRSHAVRLGKAYGKVISAVAVSRAPTPGEAVPDYSYRCQVCR